MAAVAGVMGVIGLSPDELLNRRTAELPATSWSAPLSATIVKSASPYPLAATSDILFLLKPRPPAMTESDPRTEDDEVDRGFRNELFEPCVVAPPPPPPLDDTTNEFCVDLREAKVEAGVGDVGDCSTIGES